MSKLTVAFLSFIVGAVSSFAFSSSFGSQASTLTQAISVPRNSVPVVPPLSNITSAGNSIRGTFLLDGVNSEGDTFENATIVYGGGSFRLIQPKFSGGQVRLQLVGAARNTAYLTTFLQLVEAGQHPKPAVPQKPLEQLVQIKQAITADLLSSA